MRIPCAGEQTPSGHGDPLRHPSADTGKPDGVSPQAWAEDTMSETIDRGAQPEGPREALQLAAQWARDYAGYYPAASDGRNTFVVLAERLEARAAALRPAVPPAPEGLGLVREPAVDGMEPERATIIAQARTESERTGRAKGLHEAAEMLRAAVGRASKSVLPVLTSPYALSLANRMDAAASAHSEETANG